MEVVFFVSIPFIAGQWSLRRMVGVAGSVGARFNPLHCGAVVASSELDATADEAARFQSPSLRGSGRFIEPPGGVLALLLSFQSPSLRGSGRFKNQGGSK